MTTASTDNLKFFLADTYTLLLKTHSFHWNVKGPQFFSLHALFEEQYKDLLDAADMVAERISTLGEYAPGGLKAYKKMTSIDEPQENADADTMLHTLIVDNQKLADRAQIAIGEATETGDKVTVDMLAGRLQRHEKQIWMMKNFLESEHHKVSIGKRFAA